MHGVQAGQQRHVLLHMPLLLRTNWCAASVPLIVWGFGSVRTTSVSTNVYLLLCEGTASLAGVEGYWHACLLSQLPAEYSSAPSYMQRHMPCCTHEPRREGGFYKLAVYCAFACGCQDCGFSAASWRLACAASRLKLVVYY